MYFLADWTGMVVQEIFGEDANDSCKLMIVNAGPRGIVQTIISKFSDETEVDYLQGLDKAIKKFPGVLASWPMANDNMAGYKNLKLISSVPCLKVKATKTS